VLKFLPALECGLRIAGEHDDLVLDLKPLLDSARRPGGYFLLTCECGIADDAGIEEAIFVQHPSPDTIEWDIDIQGALPAFYGESWLAHQEGYLRLLFDRHQYVDDLRRMVAEVQQANRELELYGVAGSGDYGFVEELLAFDFDAPIIAEPILPPGTHLEFRLEGSECCWLDGKPLRGWPTWFFPRWPVNLTFNKWMGFVHRGYAIKDAAQPLEPNQFYMLNEDDRTACDAAGYEMVRVFRRCLDESVNSREITVSYSPCLLPAITRTEPA
jgi:hypothetical protein